MMRSLISYKNAEPDTQNQKLMVESEVVTRRIPNVM